LRGNNPWTSGFFPSKKFTLVEHYKTWGISASSNLHLTIQIKIYNIVGEEVYEYEGQTDNGKWTGS